MIIAVGIGGICKAMEDIFVLSSLGSVCYHVVLGPFQITKYSLQHAHVLHARVCRVGCQPANCIAYIWACRVRKKLELSEQSGIQVASTSLVAIRVWHDGCTWVQGHCDRIRMVHSLTFQDHLNVLSLSDRDGRWYSQIG